MPAGMGGTDSQCQVGVPGVTLDPTLSYKPTAECQLEWGETDSQCQVGVPGVTLDPTLSYKPTAECQLEWGETDSQCQVGVPGVTLYPQLQTSCHQNKDKARSQQQYLKEAVQLQVLPLPCATEQLNMSALYGAALHMPRRWTQSSICLPCMGPLYTCLEDGPCPNHGL